MTLEEDLNLTSRRVKKLEENQTSSADLLDEIVLFQETISATAELSEPTELSSTDWYVGSPTARVGFCEVIA